MRKILEKIHDWQFTAKKLYSSKSNVKLKNPNKSEGNVIISCKNPELNHYSVHYNKFDVVPLASKGWKHSKSVGDYFVVHPHRENLDNVYTFGELGLHRNIIDILKAQKITKATEFQYQASQAVQAGN